MPRIFALDMSHSALVDACKETFKDSETSIPISVVSLSEKPKEQVVVADTTKFSPAEIAKTAAPSS